MFCERENKQKKNKTKTKIVKKKKDVLTRIAKILRFISFGALRGRKN